VPPVHKSGKHQEKTMFAIIRTGGKQYKVAKDGLLRVEKLDAKEGDKLTFEGDSVLFAMGGKAAKVSATVVRHERADKVLVFKKKRRTGYKRTRGHKQHHTVLQITNVA
jgi:large subunit ribosomal protein L21